MKNILIALDYDPSAQKVAETGHELAKAMNAKTVLLHIVSDPTQYSYLDYSPIMGFGGFAAIDLTQKDTPGELGKAAEEYLDKSKKHLGDETIETRVSHGNYGEAILAAAAETRADVIVMGTHSRRGLDKILMGSVAEDVLRHSKIPVLIIPTRDGRESDKK